MKDENRSNLLILFAAFAALFGAVIALLRWLDKLPFGGKRTIHRSFQQGDGELRRGTKR